MDSLSFLAALVELFKTFLSLKQRITSELLIMETGDEANVRWGREWRRRRRESDRQRGTETATVFAVSQQYMAADAAFCFNRETERVRGEWERFRIRGLIYKAKRCITRDICMYVCMYVMYVPATERETEREAGRGCFFYWESERTAAEH